MGQTRNFRVVEIPQPLSDHLSLGKQQHWTVDLLLQLLMLKVVSAGRNTILEHSSVPTERNGNAVLVKN